MEFQIIPYSSMNEFITAAQNQTTGYSRNIQLSDGTYAYINSQGIAKKFNSMADYTATKGKNGCPGEAEVVTRTWENVQYRVGAPMMAGQSCGNESKLVSSKLDTVDNEFDKAYYESNSGKTFGTVQEAVSDWKTKGRSSGIAPFDGALSLQKLNKLGYVDVDSIFHEMTPEISNTYTTKNQSYVTGNSMTTCLPSESVNFRDKVYIKTGNSYLYADGRSVKVYTGSLPLPVSCEFYIQVPINSVSASGPSTRTATLPTTALYAQSLAYGDNCIISTRNTWNTDSCGFWGCYTSKIYNGTFSLSDSALSTNLNFISTTGITNNTVIKFGEQFNIIGEVYKNVLRQGETLTTLIAGDYVLSFSGGKLFIKNNQTGSIEILKEGISSKAVNATWNGNIMYFTSSNGRTMYASYMYTATGCSDGKCKLVLTNTGLLKVVSSAGTVITTSNSAIPDSEDVPIETYAKIVNGQLSFTENISDRDVFSFVSTKPVLNSCDLTALQTKCNTTQNCIGFIHSKHENTWQPIKSTDKDGDFKISEKDTDIYLRYMSGKLTGTYCPTQSAPSGLNRSLLEKYPKGPVVSSPSAGCTERPRLIVPAFETYLKSIDSAISTPQPPPVGVNELQKFPTELAPLLDEYQNSYKSWLDNKGKPTPLGNTLKQRLSDTYAVDEYYKSMAILWGIITMAMIAIILFRARN